MLFFRYHGIGYFLIGITVFWGKTCGITVFHLLSAMRNYGILVNFPFGNDIWQKFWRCDGIRDPYKHPSLPFDNVKWLMIHNNYSKLIGFKLVIKKTTKFVKVQFQKAFFFFFTKAKHSSKFRSFFFIWSCTKQRRESYL